jgi:hypothetical protein
MRSGGGAMNDIVMLIKTHDRGVVFFLGFICGGASMFVALMLVLWRDMRKHRRKTWEE